MEETTLDLGSMQDGGKMREEMRQQLARKPLKISR